MILHFSLYLCELSVTFGKVINFYWVPQDFSLNFSRGKYTNRFYLQYTILYNFDLTAYLVSIDVLFSIIYFLWMEIKILFSITLFIFFYNGSATFHSFIREHFFRCLPLKYKPFLNNSARKLNDVFLFLINTITLGLAK